MARHLLRVGREDHRPGHGGGAAVQLAIHEVRDPAEEQPDRHDHGDAVAEGQRVQPLLTAKQQGRDDHAERPAVERHAALPHHQRLERSLRVVSRFIEQHVAQPPAEDDAKRRPGDEVVHLPLGAGPGRRLDDAPGDAPAQHDAGDVGERVPADRERPELERDRVYVGEGEHGAGGLAQDRPDRNRGARESRRRGRLRRVGRDSRARSGTPRAGAPPGGAGASPLHPSAARSSQVVREARARHPARLRYARSRTLT